MSVSLKLALALVASEVIASPSELVGNLNVQHTIEDKQTLNATSTAPATKAYSDRLTLTAGAADIDLTALTDAANNALTLLGLKVQAIAIKAAATNTAKVAVAAGSSNGYLLLAAAAGKVEVPAGGSLFMSLNETAPDVGASAKVLALTSTDTDAIVDIVIIAG